MDFDAPKPMFVTFVQPQKWNSKPIQKLLAKECTYNITQEEG